MDIIKLIQSNKEFSFPLFEQDKRNLVVALGSLGDFDSFEYIQNLNRYYEKLKVNNIKLTIFAIGTEESKSCFARYVEIPENLINMVSDNSLHKKLGINDGMNFPVSAAANLLIMCAGINSPGTLKEVFRGYLGDKDSIKIFNNDDNNSLFLSKKSKFNTILFDKFNSENCLRPFELATLRLFNMLEIFANWKSYFPNQKYMSQRCATFLYDYEHKLIHSYFSNSLLNYSENMSYPLRFIEENLRIKIYDDKK